jgi:hypothetical protein
MALTQASPDVVNPTQTGLTTIGTLTGLTVNGTGLTVNGKSTFNGTTSTLATKIINALEKITISATAATGTINYDITTQSIIYYTSNASNNWTLNFYGNGSTTLDSLMAVGEAVSVVFMAQQGSSAFYNNAITVDTSATVTTKWQGGAAPTAGNTNSIDVYSYSIIKTATSTFTVLASQTRFA